MILPVFLVALIFAWAWVCFTAQPEEAKELGAVLLIIVAVLAVIGILS